MAAQFCRRLGLLHVFRLSILLAVCLLLAPAARAAVLQGTYKLPASFDATVSTEMATELWAEVFRPDTEGPFPLLIFLHGNHGTCGRFDTGLGVRIDDRSDYTFSGTCPAGYVPTPNHLGYNYVAKALAKRGFAVVSINANRGVNAAPGVPGDGGLNLRRGRLVLRHMQQLSRWNDGTDTPPPSLGFGMTGLMNFSHIGLMGHSRGGEGMRAAIAQYQDAGSPWPSRIGPATFEALFEIGPVDGQTSRILNALGLAWNVLLPGCDGDVSNLQGVRPLDRMMTIGTETKLFKKSSFEVFGANHNFYNTEWQVSDASSCTGQTPLFTQFGGSQPQRKTASLTMIPFFLAHVGPAKKPGQARLFDPSQPLPTTLTAITAYARGYTPSPKTARNFVIDDFEKATGTSSRNVANQSSGLTSYAHGSASSSHDATQRAAAVNWNTAGGFLQVNASNLGVPLNVTSFPALEFRVMLRCFGSLCSSAPNPTGDVDFSIAIANSNGTLSNPITLKSVAVVRRPAGSFSSNSVLQTVRIRLSDFIGADPANFRGVRFTFNQTSSSQISLGNVRLTRTAAGPGGLAPARHVLAAGSSPQLKASRVPDTNQIVAIRRAAVASSSGGKKNVVEIEVASSRPFPIGGALPELVIGEQSFALSRFPPGATDHLIFTLEADEFASLPDGADVSVIVGGAPGWDMGRLQKQ